MTPFNINNGWLTSIGHYDTKSLQEEPFQWPFS